MNEFKLVTNRSELEIRKKVSAPGLRGLEQLPGGDGGRNPEAFSLGGLEAARTQSRAMDMRPPGSTAVTAWMVNTWAGQAASPLAGAGGVGGQPRGAPGSASRARRPREAAVCLRGMPSVWRRCGRSRSLQRHEGLAQEGRAAHAEPFPHLDPIQHGEGKSFPVWLDLATAALGAQCPSQWLWLPGQGRNGKESAGSSYGRALTLRPVMKTAL